MIASAHHYLETSINDGDSPLTIVERRFSIDVTTI